ncbi:hypothetical protein KI387_000787, partial [Taxus chinensis]
NTWQDRKAYGQVKGRLPIALHYRALNWESLTKFVMAQDQEKTKRLKLYAKEDVKRGLVRPTVEQLSVWVPYAHVLSQMSK